MFNNRAQFGFEVGDLVFLTKNPGTLGIIIEIDRGLTNTTTCCVQWNQSLLKPTYATVHSTSDLVLVEPIRA